MVASLHQMERKLPQTGEEAPASPIIGWLLRAASVALWYVRKRNKRDAA
ncbi:hypothetical protein DOE73_23080 [Paenibacillus dendritiformis]|nr:hypothetical protein DOE73_23080 [Paenibacillus dendritiformis]